PTANQFMGKLSWNRENDSRARPQIQIIVAEKESRRKIVEHRELLIAARRQFQVGVAVIPDRRIKWAVAGYSIDLIVQAGRERASPNRILSAGSAAVSRYGRRRIEDRDLLLNIECVVPENPAVVGGSRSARRLVIN